MTLILRCLIVLAAIVLGSSGPRAQYIIQPPPPATFTCPANTFASAYLTPGGPLTCSSGIATGSIAVGGPQQLTGYNVSGNAVVPFTVGTNLSVSGNQLNVDLTGLAVASRTISTAAPLTGGGDLSANRTLSIQGNGITNTLLATMPASTLKGSIAGGTPADLTATQTTALLNACAATLKGLVPAPPNDGTKYLDGTCTFSTPSVTVTTLNNATITGGTISGATISGLPAPVNPGDAATKGYADGLLASPALTGTPTAPTAAIGTNSTQIATTAFVKSQNYLTANQTITLTGPVTGSGSTSIATTIGAGQVSGANLAAGAAVANLGYTPLNPASNLSDVSSATTARTNLGLGNAATATIPTAGLIGGTGSAFTTVTVGTGLNLSGGVLIATAAGGNVTGPASSVAGHIATFANASGQLLSDGGALGTMSVQNSNAVTITGGAITGLSSPTLSSDAATKAYVDSVAVGIVTHTQVAAATAAVLPNTPTYNNASGGVGATLTAGANAALVIDGQTISVTTTRVLVKDQATGAQNGIYTLTQAGTGAVPWILTRATDFDQAAAGEVAAGAYVFVNTGTANAASGWQMITPNPITMGTTALTWTQFLGSTAYQASGGLQLIGNTFSIATGGAAANVGTLGGVLSGTLPNPSMAAGAAAANVGALGGDLSGTLPNPSVLKVNGVAYPSSPSTNTVAVVTGANTVAYTTVPAAGLSAGAAATNVGSLSGDLSGTLPSPTVSKVNGVVHPSGPSLNTVPVVTNAASGGTVAYQLITSSSIAAGAAATNVGTLGGVLSGTLPNPGMTAGAAATNVGTLGGALSGTLPNPSLAAGVAATNVGALGGDLSGTLPNPVVAKVNGVAHPAAPTVNTVPVVTSAAGGGTVTYQTVPPAAGGTGVNNGTNTLTLGGNLTTSGAFATTLISTATTSITLPTSGTVFSSATVNGGSACNGTNFLQFGGGLFSCAGAPAQATITLGPHFTVTRGTDNAGPLVPGTSTLFWQDAAKVAPGGSNYTIALSDIDYTIVMNDTVTRTVTLPAATNTTGVAGSKFNGFCVADQSNKGFTLSSSTAMYGMPGVSNTSYTFSAGSFVCPSSDGSTWRLTGYHGVFPVTQLPTSAVTPGSYTNTNLTVDQYGRITAATSGSAGGGGADTIANNLTAVGTGSSNCLALTATQNRVTGSSSSTAPYSTASAVCLPVPTQGGHTVVNNTTANYIQACPTTGVQINNLTVSTGCIPVPPNTAATFWSQITTEWSF